MGGGLKNCPLTQPLSHYTALPSNQSRTKHWPELLNESDQWTTLETVANGQIILIVRP